MAQSKNSMTYLIAGVFAFIIMVLWANHWIAKELQPEDKGVSVKPAALKVEPAQEMSAPKPSNIDEESPVSAVDNVPANQSSETQNQRIIYEKPLDDVILVQ